MSDTAGPEPIEEIAWHKTGDAEVPYQALVHGKPLTIRLNDFPDEPLYTLLVDGVESRHFDDWPAKWHKMPADDEAKGADSLGRCASSSPGSC